jgi:hypothetical protein
LTALLETAPVSPTPTGSIVFFVDGVAQSPPVPLVVVNGGAFATLVLSGLAPGNHQVTASYAGDPFYSSSVSMPTTFVVNPVQVPVSSDGPRVVSVQRFGYHAMPTLVLITSRSIRPARTTRGTTSSSTPRGTGSAWRRCCTTRPRAQ